MSSHGTSRAAGDSAARLLRLASQSTEMIPPVKSIVDGALRIAELVLQFNTSQKEWKEFQVHVQNAVATVLHSLASIDDSQSERNLKLEQFQRTLQGIAKRIEAKRRDPLGLRMIRFLEHPTVIAEMRKELDEAVWLFGLGATIRMEIAIEKVFQLLIQLNKPKAPAITLDSSLSKFRVKGASWDQYRGCMEQTRKKMTKAILAWINDTNGVGSDRRICLLTGVAGSGKSTIAHTIARQCDENRQLASSFFFNCDTDNRNNPEHLIGTVAADLCSADSQLARRILAAVEDNAGILQAPISRQFEKLILEPCSGFSAQPPLVIVLDALDECYGQDLLRILGEDACRLPPSIRFFVTSRISSDTEALLRKPHVQSISLDIYDKDNLDDIAVFVHHKLQEVAECHELAEWPDLNLIAAFEAKAGGLFLWVATTCDYLTMCYDPQRELWDLVSASHGSKSSAESMMDKLYTRILLACNWKDTTFVDGFHRLLGAAASTKAPLTLRALNALYQCPLMPSHLALRQLSPLLTGLIDKYDVPQPVRFLHQSLRDFLTLRAGGPNAPAGSHIFLIDDKIHSQTLALLCLSLLNRELKSGMLGVGYLAKYQEEHPVIPLINKRNFSEELLYACRFWIEHLLDVEPYTLPDAMEQLEVFIKTKLTLWMELTAACGCYEGLSKLHKWAMDKAKDYPTLKQLLYDPEQASTSHSLTKCFEYMGRREEALTATRDEVAVCRRLAEDCKHDSQVELAKSLCNFSECLIHLALFEDAFGAAYEAVSLQRQLRVPNQDVFNIDLARALRCLAVALTQQGKYQEGLAAIEESVTLQRCHQIYHIAGTQQMSDLAKSLGCLSANLYHFGRYEEALQVIQEGVDIYRKLSTEHPTAFISELSKSLHSISCDFSKLGRYQESLRAIQEAVDLRRQLADKRPAVFNSDLAQSLHGLSYNFSCLGHLKEALTTIQEAVAMYRQLAAERPAVFTSGLAQSLHSLSYNFSSLGHHKEALTTIQEAVAMYRQLAAERPAVFTSSLAQSFHSLSSSLSNMGHHEEALTTIQEAVSMHQRLAAECPEVFTPELARSLHIHSYNLSNIGYHKEALTSLEDAVALRQQLAAEHPAVFTPDLAHSLHNLAHSLFILGCHKEALKTMEEAVTLRRHLAAQHPAVFTSDLAHSLKSLSSHLSNHGCHEEALRTTQEAVVLCRQLVAECPAAFTSTLANSLHTLSCDLSDLGCHDKALAAVQEAIQIFRSLAMERPTVFNSDLALALYQLAGCSYSLYNDQGAAAAIKESVELYRPLAQQYPAKYATDFSDALQRAASYLSDIGAEKEAQEIQQELDALSSAGL